MNTENKDQFVYVPVSVDDEFPDVGTFYWCIVSKNEWNTNDEAECFFNADTKRWTVYPNDGFIEVTHWLKKVPLSSLLPKTIIEPANTSARLDDSCVTPLYGNKSIEQ